MVELGDKVKDPVTGIEGIAYVRNHYLQGCDRVGIQQEAYKNKDGDLMVPDIYFVDEPQLIILEKGVVECQADVSATGGPSGFARDSKRDK